MCFGASLRVIPTGVGLIGLLATGTLRRRSNLHWRGADIPAYKVTTVFDGVIPTGVGLITMDKKSIEWKESNPHWRGAD